MLLFKGLVDSLLETCMKEQNKSREFCISSGIIFAYPKSSSIAIFLNPRRIWSSFIKILLDLSMTSRFITVLVLFALLPAQSYSTAEGKGISSTHYRWIDSNEFTAEFMADEGYYASVMPVSLRIKFSSVVIDLDVTHFLVLPNARVDFRQPMATFMRCKGNLTPPTNSNSSLSLPEKSQWPPPNTLHLWME